MVAGPPRPGAAVEGVHDEMERVGPGLAHLADQGTEVRPTASTTVAELAVEDRRSRRQAAEGLHHRGQLPGPLRGVLGVEPDVAAVLDDLDAETIPFGLVRPLVAFRWGFAGDGKAGTDESETLGHAALFRRPRAPTQMRYRRIRGRGAGMFTGSGDPGHTRPRRSTNHVSRSIA